MDVDDPEPDRRHDIADEQWLTDFIHVHNLAGFIRWQASRVQLPELAVADIIPELKGSLIEERKRLTDPSTRNPTALAKVIITMRRYRIFNRTMDERWKYWQDTVSLDVDPSAADEDGRETSPQIPDTDPRPDQIAVVVSALERVRTIVGATDFAIAVLSIAGFTARGAGLILNLPEGTVRPYRLRVMALLRSLLEGERTK